MLTTQPALELSWRQPALPVSSGQQGWLGIYPEHADATKARIPAPC